MKRRIAVLLTIALLLSLSACGDDPGVGDPPLLFTKPAVEEDPTKPSNIVPTQVPTVAPTAAPTQEPTQAPTAIPTEPPTEEPTQAPTEGPAVNMAEILAEWEAASKYAMPPYAYIAFVYKTNSEYDYAGEAFDQSNMIEGYFYAVHDGDVYLIAESNTTYTSITNEHLYYIATNEHHRIYRSDHYGNQKEVIYEAPAGRNVTSFTYAGKNSDGILFVVEDEHRLLQYDLASKETTVLLEANTVYLNGFPQLSYDLPVADEILANGPFLSVTMKAKETDEFILYRYWLVSKKLEEE